MERLQIRKKMIPLILTGSKTSTSRKGVREFNVFDKLVFVAIEDDSCTADTIITEVQYCKFSELTEAEAIAEGYDSLEEMQEVLKELYNPADDDMFTLIKFMPCYQVIELSNKTATRGLHVGHRHYCSNCGELACMENYCSRCGAKVIKKEDFK